MINLLKNIGIVGMMLTALSGIGIVINQLVPWGWLTKFFIILRYFGNLFDWGWDMTTTWTVVGITFSIQIALWAFKATVAAVNYFKNN